MDEESSVGRPRSLYTKVRYVRLTEAMDAEIQRWREVQAAEHGWLGGSLSDAIRALLVLCLRAGGATGGR